MRYTSKDVARKVELINVRLNAAGKPDLHIASTNPDGKGRRYEFAGWVYHDASEAGRALDAMLFIMHDLCITERQSAYVARAIDVARSDREASALLSPVERDELLRHFGGRRENGDDE